MRAPLLSLAAGSLAVLGACADSTPMSPLTSPELGPLASSTSVTEPASGPWARVVQGETGPGSLYAIYVPRTPNQTRDVVFYAHGFRDAATPVDLRDQDQLNAIRDELGALGYAVAYSSFAENGFVVKDGAQRTHQLRGLVAAELGGQPGRSFLMGHSLGGAIGLYLAETHPTQYDGALLMCGMVGGSLLETQYVGNVRALFDFFYPTANLAGNVLSFPTNIVPTPDQISGYIQARVVPAVLANPSGLLAIASTAQTPLPVVRGAEVQTLLVSLIGALSFHARGIDNVLDITNGHSPFDNTANYTIGTPFFAAAPAMIAAANDPQTGVTRYAADPSARNYLERHFTPTGDLRIPVLTLHNTFDPGVPAFHETALLAAVQGANATDNLFQRFIGFRGSIPPGGGHCDIRPGEAVRAFQDLERWVTTGVKPAA